jgi:endonuclease/exonuclease/phosphatase family metal-dependent hydrolase
MELDNQTHITTRENKFITIWQQNVNKSRICQHDLISSARLTEIKADIVALQELAISDLVVTIATRDWRVIYPSTHAKDPSKTRSVILIRANILTDYWSQVDIDSGDVTIIRLKGAWGTLTLLNIYNDCEHDDTIELLRDFQRGQDENDQCQVHKDAHTVWLGDFNRHHLHWDKVTNDRLFTRTAIKKSEKLISAVADAGLDLALPPKIPMH